MQSSSRASQLKTRLLEGRETILTWGGVLVALLVHRWVTAPLPPAGGLLAPGLWFVAIVGWQALETPAVVARLNRGRTDGRGLWMTPLSGRVRRAALAAPLAALAGYLAYASALLTLGDHPIRAVVAGAAAGASLAVFVHSAIRAWRVVVELRVDATGVFTRRWRGTIPWEAIDFVASSADRERVIRLMARPTSTAPGLPRATREGGGFVAIRLEDSEAPREAVVAAMVAARPDLTVTPWGGGVVLPIRGATDVPEPVRVETYG